MGKTHKAIGAGIAFFGFVIFAVGFYIIPFGTDVYLWFWIKVVFHGNWLYGDIAANLFAIFLIVAGILILHAEHRSPIPQQRKRKSKKKKSKKAKIEEEVMYL